jgi:ribosome biogenesis GTPase
MIGKCQFSDCSHTDEPDCAVRTTVENGSVHPERYESYLRIKFDED